MAEPPINELVRSFAAMARKAPQGLPFRPSDVVTVVKPAPAPGGSFASEDAPPAFHMRAVLPSKAGREVFVTLVESSGGRLRIHASTDAPELAGATVRVALGASRAAPEAPPPPDAGLPAEVTERVVLRPSATGGCNGEADLGPFAEVRRAIGEGDVRLSVVLVEPRVVPGPGEGPATGPPAEGRLAHAAWPPWPDGRVEPIGPPNSHSHSHTAGFLRDTGCAQTLGYS